jgi:hypothetical protein
MSQGIFFVEFQKENPLIGHNMFMGIFTIRVPFFCHKIQRLFFCYLPNPKCKWNKFKWEVLDNSKFNNFHGGDGFSHAYVIMHKYFVKKTKMQKWINKFLYTT